MKMAGNTSEDVKSFCIMMVCVVLVVNDSKSYTTLMLFIMAFIIQAIELSSNIPFTFSLFSKSRSIKRLDLFLNSLIRRCCSFWCTTTITFLSTSSKFFTESMNSFDLSSIGPISCSPDS
jgi:hypothetical protein